MKPENPVLVRLNMIKYFSWTLSRKANPVRGQAFFIAYAENIPGAFLWENYHRKSL